MDIALASSGRFRAARERAGLSIAQTAARAGISASSVWDLETHDDELMTAYSPADLLRFATIFSVRPQELLGIEDCADPISAGELVSAIREHCRARGITLDDFGEAAGWHVSKAIDSPQVLLNEISIDGIRDICRNLGIDWQRFISGLSAAA